MQDLEYSGVANKLKGSVFDYYPVIPGSNPKHIIFAFTICLVVPRILRPILYTLYLSRQGNFLVSTMLNVQVTIEET